MGPTKVLTAAHCFSNKHTRRWAHPSKINYLAAYSFSQYMEQSKVKSYRLSDSNLPNLAAIKKGLTKDWAILELEKLLGDKVGFLPLMPIKDKEIAQAGYTNDKPHVLIVKRNAMRRVDTSAC